LDALAETADALEAAEPTAETEAPTAKAEAQIEPGASEPDTVESETVRPVAEDETMTE
jgi:hypothetical protein